MEKLQRCYIKVFGCQMNVYDADKVADVLKLSHGIQRTQSPNDANILIMITCSIREKAEEKVYSELGRWRADFKRQRPDVMICVGGCVASQEGKKIQQKLPFVDIIFGPQTLHRLPALINRYKETGKSQIDISFPQIEKFDYIPMTKTDQYSAYVSVMEGCSKYCSYCIVPYTRGKEVSRPFDDVLAETANLASQGVKEIIFLGQNVNDYIGLMDDGTQGSLAILIHYAAKIDGIERIRFTTSHPNAFGDDLIDCYANQPVLANHLHLPVQSGSDRILSKMKRDYTALEYKQIINRLRRYRPGITISSDFIVGFPGETDDDFQRTCDLVDAIGFDKSYSFCFSPRPGTPAASLKDDISMDVKKKRLEHLQYLLSRHEERISQSMLGSHQQVLVMGASKKQDQSKTTIYGRTPSNRIIHFDGSLNLCGQFKTIRVEQSLKNCLRGTLID